MPPSDPDGIWRPALLGMAASIGGEEGKRTLAWPVSSAAGGGARVMKMEFIIRDDWVRF